MRVYKGPLHNLLASLPLAGTEGFTQIGTGLSDHTTLSPLTSILPLHTHTGSRAVGLAPAAAAGLRSAAAAADYAAGLVSRRISGRSRPDALISLPPPADTPPALPPVLDAEGIATYDRLVPSSTKAHTPTVAVYADSITIKSGKARKLAGSGGVRGACRGFSNASRRRLILTLSRVQVAGMVPMFVTLTYPGEWSDNWRVWKRDIAAWRKRLLRRWPAVVGGVWRVEFQKRGAPHFHLLVWCKQSLPRDAFRSWLSQSWYEVVGSGDLRHLRAGTNAKELDGRRAIRLYISKYVAKVGDGDQPDGWGRNWGFFGQVANEALIDMEIELADFHLLRRFLRRLLRSRGRKLARFSSYVARAESVSVLSLGAESTQHATMIRYLDSMFPGALDFYIALCEAMYNAG